MTISTKIYNFAQVFFLDPSLTKNSSEAGISKIDLYFRAKPPATNNKSGITNPGIELTIVPCRNGVPYYNDIEDGKIIARKEWGSIVPSTDASIPTSFSFPRPIFLKTGKEYAIAIKFDGNEDFILWSSKKGDLIVGSQQISPGITSPNVGNLYTFITPISSNNNGQDVNYISTNWKPVTDTDIKFKLYVARYFNSGVPVFTNNSISTPFNSNGISYSNGVVSVASQAENNEYITYDYKNSIVGRLNYGEKVYQDTPAYPGGTASPLTVGVVGLSSLTTPMSASRVITNASYVLPSGLSFYAAGGFNNIFSGVGDEYIVVKSGANVNIRKIVQVISSTELLVDEPFTFSNSAATFFKAPIGFIKNHELSYLLGRDTHLITLYNSNANSTVRFVNNTITNANIVTAGRGYSNSDYILINGYEDVDYAVKGGYPAMANLVTSPSGNVIGIYLSNVGAGFANASWLTGANVQILNSSGLPVQSNVANNFTLTLEIGSRLKTEFAPNNYFANISVININAMRATPEIDINNPLGTNYSISHKFLYYSTPDSNTSSGKAYYVLSNNDISNVILKNYKSQAVSDYSNSLVVPSRSNQFAIRYANGGIASANVIGINKSNSSILTYNLKSNNDYVIPYINPDISRLHFSQYIINDDYTNEHTNYGNAYSKHIGTKVSFGDDRYAEDLIVYLTAWRPSGTDFAIYARIHNANDPNAFDDKDWTLLECVDGNNVYSSRDNPADFIELTYNFRAYPNTEYTCNGTVKLVQGSANVIGSSTLFTTELDASDLVKIYNPLIPNNYIVAVVNNVVNTSMFTIRRTLGDVSANNAGTVWVDSAITDISGTSTKFLTDYQSGDYIVVWSNSTNYDVRQINKITSDTAMNVISVFSFANNISNYGKLSSNNVIDLSVSGSGLRVDKLEYPRQAFNNQPNENVVRYYCEGLKEYDGFNTFQIKIVPLSDNPYVAPKVDDYRAIGTSS